MISGVTMKINIDEYLMNALKEDITQYKRSDARTKTGRSEFNL